MIDARELRRLARAMALELAPGEAERLAPELDRRLSAIRERLAGVDPSNGLPPELPGPRLRRDVPGADPLRVPAAEFAPRWADGYFVATAPGTQGGTGAEYASETGEAPP